MPLPPYPSSPGVLACLDGYMNIAMEGTEEYVGGQLKAKYGDCFIRGNNGARGGGGCGGPAALRLPHAGLAAGRWSPARAGCLRMSCKSPTPPLTPAVLYISTVRS